MEMRGIRMLRTGLVVTVLGASVVLGAAAPLAAQATTHAPGPYARIVVIAPRPGQATAFDAGYQRHIEWHRTNRDPWTWYGWSFVLGPRLGQFMDGSFGHAAADFDNPIDPAGDRANNAANVTPYADFVSHGVYRRIDEISRGAPLPDTSAYLVLTTYQVRPGSAAAFEHAVGARAAAAGGRSSWFRLELGGGGPQYLLMRGAPSWESAVMLPDPLGPDAGTIVESVTTELLRYLPTHSYHPPS